MRQNVGKTIKLVEVNIVTFVFLDMTSKLQIKKKEIDNLERRRD